MSATQQFINFIPTGEKSLPSAVTKDDLKPAFLNPCRRKLVWLLAFFLLQSASKVQAQQEVDYAIHANIIYHFTKYIDWPANKKNGDFIIGVIGESSLYDELKKNVASKTVGKQKIVIEKFSASSVSFKCQILFIGEDENRSLKKINAATIGNPVLLVTENGPARKGSCINFVIMQEHLKLEINKINIENRGLSIATEFLSLGKIVK